MSAVDEDGWFATSDRARFAEDGRLEILGRLDDVLISGGENISVASVEGKLRKLPGIADCFVCGVADPEWGEKLVALVEAGAELRPNVSTFPRHERPKQVFLVDELPRLSTGKIDRRRAKALLETRLSQVGSDSCP